MITFTRSTPGTYTESTGAFTSPTVTTITGNAIKVRGRPDQYAAAGLVLSTMPTLLFTPTNYDLQSETTDFVQPGDTVVWNGETYTVKNVETVAPDGIVIMARVIIAQ